MNKNLSEDAYTNMTEKDGSQLTFKDPHVYTLEGIKGGDSIAVTVSRNTIKRLKAFHFEEKHMVNEVASFFLEWALYTIEGDLPGALSLFSDKEKGALAGSADILLEGESFTPHRLALHLWDFMTIDCGMLWEWSEKEITDLVEKLSALNSSQAAALLVWAKCFWTKTNMSLNEYVSMSHHSDE